MSKTLGIMLPVMALIVIASVSFGCFFRERFKKTGDKKHCKKALMCMSPVIVFILLLLFLFIAKLH